jgi:hypothetical protein
VAKKNLLMMMSELKFKNHVPLAIDEIYIGLEILKQKGSSAPNLAGATPKAISESYLKLIKNRINTTSFRN